MKNDELPGSDKAIKAEALKYGGESFYSAILEITETITDTDTINVYKKFK